jgi:hypothetical protein
MYNTATGMVELEIPEEVGQVLMARVTEFIRHRLSPETQYRPIHMQEQELVKFLVEFYISAHPAGQHK